MSANVGRRWLWILLGLAVGFVAGALLALPVAFWLATPWVDGGPSAPRWGVLACLFLAALGAAVGGAVAFARTASPHAAREIVTITLWTTLGGAVVGVAFGGAVGAWLGSLGLAVGLAFVLTLVAVVGGLRDAIEAGWESEKARRKALNQRLWELEVQQIAREYASPAPRDDAGSAAIRSGEGGQLTTARHTPDDAPSDEEDE